MAKKKKEDEEDDDPNWKNHLYIGPVNLGPFMDVQEYKKYAEDLARKGKDFLTFSEWRRKIKTVK